MTTTRNDDTRKAKRGQGEGTWRQRNGRWEYRFSVTDPTTGFGRQRSVTGATKEECRARADKVTKDARKAGTSARIVDTMTLGEWAARWLADVLPTSDRRASTRSNYDSMIRNHIVGTPIARTKLRDLTGLAIETHIAKRTLGPASKRNLHACLAAVLADAVRDRRIVDNPMRDAKRPRKPASKRSTAAKALSDADVRIVTAAVAGQRLAPLVTVALHTGMRRGELAGLRWVDVDLDAGTIHVRQQATAYGDDDELKTINADRIIPLTAPARDALIGHGLDEQARLARCTDPRTDLVFTGRTGQGLDLRALSRWYSGVIHDINHPKDGNGDPVEPAQTVTEQGLHSLRHTFASRALAAGIAITDVSAWLGHADPAITLSIYSWALPGREQSSIDRLAQHYASLT